MNLGKPFHSSLGTLIAWIALGAVPALSGLGFYLFLNPVDFWQRIVASLASIGLGFVVLIIEIVFLMVISD